MGRPPYSFPRGIIVPAMNLLPVRPLDRGLLLA
jgi:hypothetical protein